MGYSHLHNRYNCRNCRRRKYKYCDIHIEAMESARKLATIKQRGMLLNQTKEEYRKEVRELREMWREKRNKMCKCINKRIYQYLKKKYPLFIVAE